MSPNPKLLLLLFPSLLLLFFCISAVACGQAQPTFFNGYRQAQPVQGQSPSQRAFAIAAFLCKTRTEYSNAGGATADDDCFTRLSNEFMSLGRRPSINNEPRFDVSGLKSATASCFHTASQLANTPLFQQFVQTFRGNRDQLSADLKRLIRP